MCRRSHKLSHEAVMRKMNEDVYVNYDPGQKLGSDGRSKFTSERVALVVLCVLLAAAAVGLVLLYYDNMRTEESLQSLRAEHEAMKTNLTGEKCITCEDGWETDGKKCYYFSTNKLTWSESRDACQYAGGDLVKISSVEEQKFLEKALTEKKRFDEDKLWIGLTDSEEESKWLWVDGSPLDQSLSFWSGYEPDDWKVENPNGEDCARMGMDSGAADGKSWFDRSCEIPHKRICGKEGIPVPPMCV